MQTKNERNAFDSAQRVEKFFVEMRQLQSRNKCTDTTLYDIIETFSKYHDLDVPSRASLNKIDKKMQELAGCEFLELHGCPQGKAIRPGVKACGRYVYQPTDRRRVCPLCGAPRYDSKGRPLEVGITSFASTALAHHDLIYILCIMLYVASVLFSDHPQTSGTVENTIIFRDDSARI